MEHEVMYTNYICTFNNLSIDMEDELMYTSVRGILGA